LGGLLSRGGEGHAQPLQCIEGQSFAGLAIGASALVHRRLPVEAKERLDLADDFATRAVRIEDLIEKGKEGAAQAIDAIATVGSFIGLAKEARREPGVNELFQVGQALLAELFDAPAQSGEAGAPDGEEGCLHGQVIILVCA